MAGFAGIGSTFERWDDSSAVNAWVAMAEVKSITGPTSSKEQYDSTTMDTTGGYRTYVPGLRDSGEISYTMNFTETSYETMLNDFDTTSKFYYRIVMSNTEATKLTFIGFVTGIPVAVPVDDMVTADVTIKVTGPVYLNPTWDPDDSAAPSNA